MSLPVHIRLAAKFDIADAEDWYEKRAPGLGLEFRAAAFEAVARIASDAFIYPELLWGNRRLVMHRFPYNIWFRVVSSGCARRGGRSRETGNAHASLKAEGA